MDTANTPRHEPGECRYFLTYRGVALPLKLVSPITEADTRNRNTFMRGYYDSQGRLAACEKIVYGEIELSHRYEYHPNGNLCRAEITLPDEETAVLRFDESGAKFPA